MNSLKQRLLTNWHLSRIMRTGIGVMMLVMGIQSRDWMIGAFSAFFLYQGITDTGCCGTQGCYAPQTRNSKSAGETEAVEYEEIK